MGGTRKFDIGPEESVNPLLSDGLFFLHFMITADSIAVKRRTIRQPITIPAIVAEFMASLAY